MHELQNIGKSIICILQSSTVGVQCTLYNTNVGIYIYIYGHMDQKKQNVSDALSKSSWQQSG